MQLRVTALPGPGPDGAPVEIVERKSVGHPDTLCDALAEHVSIGLSRHYLERFGAILHHNVDKALLLGGAARPAFGGGEVLEPIEITLAGRATRRFGGEPIAVDDLMRELSYEWLGENLRYFDAREFRIVPRIRETSTDLSALFLRRSASGAPLANDTSFGVGYAPLDRLERTVLEVERTLTSGALRSGFPEWGDDAKVMGWRHGKSMSIVLACAFVDRHVRDLPDYRLKKERLRTVAADAAARAAGAPVELDVNAADGDTADSIYLTVTGLSAEAGDDGQVGRGNRVNGLITPYRPMSLEAAAGKNPATHTGKLYNLLAMRISDTLCREIDDVLGAECRLLSRIGSPIDEPRIADVGLRLAPGVPCEAASARAAEVVRAHLAGAETLWRSVIGGRCPVY